MNSNRIKACVLALLGVVLLIRAYGLFDQYMMKPLNDREAQLQDLKQDLQLQKRMESKIIELNKLNQQWVSRSLPKRTGVAATLYQNWLANSVDSAGFENSQITPAGILEANGDTAKLTFEITGTTDFSGLRNLLATLEVTPLLHKVNELQVRKVGTEFDDQLRINMNVEALVLNDASDREQLLTTEMLKASKANVKKRLAKEPTDASPFLVARKKPKGGTNRKKKQVTPVKKSEPPPVDHSDKVVQLGTVLSNTGSEVWLIDERTKNKSILNEGESFEFYGVKGIVHSIDADGVVLEIDGAAYLWTIAQSIKQRRKLPTKQ
ncbi:hypothetical protein N9250_00355 [bacterium]|mgnify:CR=1 FL=1|nr:hypothetical protein [bacterium]